MGIVGHMEHRAESNAPRVILRPRLADQHWDAAVDCLRELSIARGAEDRASAGVRVQECNVLDGEGEAAVRIAQLVDLSSKENELGRIGKSPCSISNGEETEPRRVMNLREDELFVLETEETCEGFPSHDVLKEELCGVIRGDAGRE